MGHIQKLERAGLVETAKTGRIRTVTLVTGSFTPIRGWLDEQREIWESRLDRLESFAQGQRSDTSAPEK